MLLSRLRAAGQNAELLDYVQSGVRKKTRSRKARAKAAVATVFVLGFLGWAVPYFRSTSTLETPAAQRQLLTLADGSKAELNARTELKTDFRYGRRVVRLKQGQVHFSVAKDTEHPFLVETPQGTIRVTGTQFDVRVESDSEVTVTLFEGAVDVANQPLTPGEQFDSGEVRTLTPVQLEAVSAWREGRLVLDGLTVSEAAERAAEFHGCTITVSPAVAQIRLGGSAPLDDLHQFFATLRAVGGLQILNAGHNRHHIAER
jgi:transmembrane sensor